MRVVTHSEKCFKYGEFVFDRLQHPAGDIITSANMGLDSYGKYESNQDEVHNKTEEDCNFSSIDTLVITLNKTDKC